MEHVDKCSIALIESNSMMRVCLSDLIKSWGYKISVLVKCFEEIGKFDRPSPDLYIIGIYLPYKSMYQTIQKLKASQPTVKVLVLTMDIGQGVKYNMPLEVDAHVSKLASLDEIKMAIDQLSRKAEAV